VRILSSSYLNLNKWTSPLIGIFKELNLFLMFLGLLILQFLILLLDVSDGVFQVVDLFFKVVDINFHLFALRLDLGLILLGLQTFSHSIGDRAFVQLLICLLRAFT